MSNQLPFSCFLIAAVTVDGFIGQSENHLSTRWTSKEDAAFFRQKSTEAGVIIMGRKTYDTIGKPLPNRVNLVYTRQAPAEAPTLETAKQLEKGQTYYTSLAPAEVVSRLQQLGFTQLAVSGGASVYRQFMASGVVNELFLTVEPVIFGQGVKLFDQPLETKLQLKEVIPISEQGVVLHYERKFL